MLLSRFSLAYGEVPPLSRAGVIDAVQRKALEETDVQLYVRRFGVDFRLSGEDEQVLLERGASAKLLSSIRSAYRKPKPPVRPVADEEECSECEDSEKISPLTRMEVLMQVWSRTPYALLRERWEERPVGFVLTPDMEKQLMEAGMDRRLTGLLILRQQGNAAQPRIAAEKGAEQEPIENGTGPLLPEKSELPASARAVTEVRRRPEPQPEPAPGPQPIAPRIAPVEPVPAGVQPVAPGRIRVDPAVQETRLLRAAVPQYPPLLQRARIQGAVRLEVVISRQGRVMSMRVLSGPTQFAQAVMDAVRQCLYKPALVEGRPVEVITEVTVRFQPE